MRSWSALSTFALAGALIASPALAASPDQSSIEGQVAAVDRASGRLVLDTDDGLVSLKTWPEELATVDVGDTVRVSFVSDENR